MNSEQLQIQRLVAYYNTYCTKTNSMRNIELLDIILDFSSERSDLDVVEESGNIYLKMNATK